MTTAAITIIAVRYSNGAMSRRARFDTMKYAVHANSAPTAIRSPDRLHTGAADEPYTTITTPPIATSDHTTTEAVTGSPNIGPATSISSAGCSAPTMVALATVVRFSALKYRTMSPTNASPAGH